MTSLPFCLAGLIQLHLSHQNWLVLEAFASNVKAMTSQFESETSGVTQAFKLLLGSFNCTSASKISFNLHQMNHMGILLDMSIQPDVSVLIERELLGSDVMQNHG